MGGKSQAKAQAAQARETARQYEDIKRRAGQVKYNKEEVLANLKAASEQIPEIAGLYEAIERDPSALEQIETDPRFDEIMKGNLDAIQEMAEETGFTEEDMAKRRSLQRAAAADAQARDKAIARDLMERGQAGSGLEILLRQKASQDTAQRQAEAANRLAMDSATARRAALAQASQQASGMQGQSFQQQATKASAADQIAAFNAMQRQRAQDANLGMRQQRENIKAQQTAGYHQAAAQTEQQRFANEMSKLGLQSNLTGAAGQARMAGVAPRTNLGGVIGTAAGAGLGAYLSGGSPQGAAAGAQVGGTIGGAFKEGGVKKYYDGGLSPEKNYDNLKFQSAFDQAMMDKGKGNTFKYKGKDYLLKRAEPDMVDESGPIGEGVVASGKVSKDELDKARGQEDKGSATAGVLAAIAKSMGSGSQAKQRTSSQLSAPQFNTAVQNMPIQMTPMQGITAPMSAEDGGVQMSAESMRDALMAEVDSFACGGVKRYEDGGKKETDEIIEEIEQQLEGDEFSYKSREDFEEALRLQELKDAMAAEPSEYAEGGMNYEAGGEGTIIDSGTENYEGDELADRINDGEMVFNVEQQDRVNDQLMELKRLKSKKRTDKMLAEGKAEINAEQQDALLAFARGEIGIDDLPNDRIVKEPTISEPSGRMAELIGMLGKKKRS